MNNKPLYCFFGHHKCGTVFIDRDVIESVCQILSLTKISAHTPGQFDPNINGMLAHYDADFFSYVNADYGYVRKIKRPMRGFHVIRDPRNILVSAYFSHRDSHTAIQWPELREHRLQLKKLDEKQGLLLEIDFIKTLTDNGIDLHPLRSMQKWDYSDDRILEIRFEDLIGNPRASYRKVFSWLGLLESSADRVARAVLPQSLERKLIDKKVTSRQFDQILESTARLFDKKRAEGSGHYRKHSSNWREYFDTDIEKKFKRAFPDIVVTLGYESSEYWSVHDQH